MHTPNSTSKNRPHAQNNLEEKKTKTKKQKHGGWLGNLPSGPRNRARLPPVRGLGHPVQGGDRVGHVELAASPEIFRAKRDDVRELDLANVTLTPDESNTGLMNMGVSNSL